MTPFRRWIASAVALFVVLALGGRTGVAQDCPQEKDAPKVIFHGIAMGAFNRSLAATLSDDFFGRLVKGVPGVSFFNTKHVAVLLGRNGTLQQLGEVDHIPGLAGALGSPFAIRLTFDETRTGSNPVKIRRIVTASLVDTHEATLMRRFDRTLPNNDNTLFGPIDALRGQLTENLRCLLLATRTRPAVPHLVASLTPDAVSPGGNVHVNATLTDSSNGQRQSGRELQVHTWQGRVLVSTARYMTNDYGVVSADLTVGPDPGPHSISVTFTDARGRTTPSNPDEIAYNVLDPSGDATISAAEAALRLGAAQTVTARLTHNGAPVAGATFNFTAAGGGTVATPGVTTDANGYASTQFQAPSTNAIVDVTATTPAPPSKGPKAGAADLTASLTLVVDGAVTLNLNALDTLAGGTSNVTADLVVAGVAIPGANVTFTLAGAGALSAATSPTNAAGRAEIIWLAPAGTSTANITAEAVVEGQTYSKTVTIRGRAAQGSMSVKVVPSILLSPDYHGWCGGTFIEVVGHGDPSRCEAASATMAGVRPCDYPTQIPADYGTTAASLPVTVRLGAELTQANTAFEMSVKQSSPDVVALDFSMSRRTVIYSEFVGWVILELSFDVAGVLRIEVDPTSYPGYPRICRPKGGGTFSDSCGETVQEDFVGSGTSTKTSEDIDIAQPETLQLIAKYVTGGSIGPLTDGRFRFTFTFTPK